MPDLPPHLIEIRDAALEGTLDDERAQLLLEWIAANPDQLPALRREAGLDAALGCLLAPESDQRLRDAVMMRLGDMPSARASGAFAARVMGRIRRRPRARARRAPTRWFPLVAAAAVVFVLGAMMLARHEAGAAPESEQPERVATSPSPSPRPNAAPAVAAAGSITARGDGVSIDGARLRAGAPAPATAGADIVVAQGSSADLRLNDGTTFALGGDARLEVASPGAPHRLDHGALAVEAAPQPKDHPLAIATARATVRVVGTAFRVESDADQTWVSVSHGRVAVAAGASEAFLDAGHELIADAAGLGAVVDHERRQVLELTLAAVNPQFDRAELGPPTGTFHGLTVRALAYPGETASFLNFVDLYITTPVPRGARRVETWVRPTAVRPQAGYDAATVAIMASVPGGDFTVAQRQIQVGDGGWLRVAGDFAAMQPNWMRDPKNPPPRDPDRIGSLAIRVLHGHVEGDLVGIVIDY